jgi:hypothetical protein
MYTESSIQIEVIAKKNAFLQYRQIFFGPMSLFSEFKISVFLNAFFSIN